MPTNLSLPRKVKSRPIDWLETTFTLGYGGGYQRVDGSIECPENSSLDPSLPEREKLVGVTVHIINKQIYMWNNFSQASGKLLSDA